MAQTAINNATTLNGILKTVYSDSVANEVPDFAILQKLSPFSKAKLVGDVFSQPVLLSQEHGFTWGGSSASAYALNSSVSMQTAPAQVKPSELTLVSQISLGIIQRAQAQDGAVENTLSLLTETMLNSTRKRVEMQMIYGQSGIGKVLSGTGTATNRVYVLSAASWAPGIYCGFEGANLDFYNGATKLNTNAPVVLVSVNASTRALTVTGNSTDLTAIDGATTNASIFQAGSYGNEPAGLDAIMTNTSVIFAIDSAQYGLWKSNVYDCASAELTMKKILSGINLAVGRGLMEDTTLFVSPDSYANINAAAAGQRLYDDSYKSTKAINGFESVEFHTSAGTCSIVPHPFVKQGDAFLVAMDGLVRIGSTDVSFVQQGTTATGDKEYLVQNPTTNSFQIRAYTDQAIFHMSPAKCVKYINIVAS